MSPAVLGVCIPIVAIIGVFTFLSIAAYSRHRYRSEERMKLYDTARAAVEKGQPLPTEVITAMAQSAPAERPPRTAFADLRSGVIMTAVGLGIFVFGYVGQVYERDVAILMGIAAIPGLIGVALIILSVFNPNKDKPN
jgi:hypothetical protein